MPRIRLNPALATAALAAATAWSGAHAAIYTGSWDPAFGQPFPSLGWRGQATYFVPDACLALGDGSISNSNPCSNGSFSVQSAHVDFYNLAAPATTVETLNYPSWAVQSITLVNHNLTGVTTGYSAVVLARSSIAGGGSDFFGLKFDGGTASLAWVTEQDIDKPIYHLGTTPPPAVTYVFVPVPEPGTLAMLACGLGMVGLAWRRRRSG